MWQQLPSQKSSAYRNEHRSCRYQDFDNGGQQFNRVSTTHIPDESALSYKWIERFKEIRPVFPAGVRLLPAAVPVNHF